MCVSLCVEFREIVLYCFGCFEQKKSEEHTYQYRQDDTNVLIVIIKRLKTESAYFLFFGLISVTFAVTVCSSSHILFAFVKERVKQDQL